MAFNGTSARLETVELQLPQGHIRGMKCETLYGESYYSFEGIPYAQPPIGKLRFRAPKPLDSWKGTLDATREPPKPLQKHIYTGEVEGSEDCLYLNVYSKNLNTNKKMPVMVWIFGGAFLIGCASRNQTGPDYLMNKDVVMVSINYRLGSLGFLSLNDPSLDVPGNAALKDQLLALKWIQNYIQYFNGDSENITVFGQSSGAYCVHILSLTEQARGLFQKAILMSGSALSQWGLTQEAYTAYLLAKHHGYNGKNEDSAVLKFLDSLDAEKLVDQVLVTDKVQRFMDPSTFTATIEPFITDHCIIPTNPLNMLKSAWSNDIPIIIGGTSFEGLLTYKPVKIFPQVIDMILKDPKSWLPGDVKKLRTDNENNEIAKRYIQMYFGENQKDEIVARQLKQDPKFDIMHLLSHEQIWHGLYCTALTRIKYATANTYIYRFDFDSPNGNIFKKLACNGDAVKGAAHNDDLGYLFRLGVSTKFDKASLEYNTIQRMVGMWTSFAKSGNPNCFEIEPIIWKPINRKNPLICVDINEKCKIIEMPDVAKLREWNSLYKWDNLFGAEYDEE